MKSGIDLIVEERNRQIQEEGWTAEHDSYHKVNEFIRAAQAYLMINNHPTLRELTWPWEKCWFKPKGDIKDLVRAGALIAAAIDRINYENKE